jgi:tetratricopeptide (TPR) repeat protein
MANNPLIELRESEAYEALGNLKSEATSAGQAAEKAQKIGARMLQAEALWRVCWAEFNLGDFSAARTSCDRGQRTASATNYRLIVARAYAVLGNISMGEGKPAEAVNAEQNALEIARAIGSQRDVIGAMQNIGNFYGYQGNHAEAVKNYQSARKVAEEIQDKNALLAMQNNIAAEYQAYGELAKALEFYGKSLVLATETQNQSGEIDARGNIGSAEAAQGKLADGLASAKRALKLARDNGIKEKIPILLCIAGDIQVDQGDLNAAAASYSEALSISGQLGDGSSAATVQLSQSKMEFERGNYQEAAKDAKAAAEEFRKEGMKEQASAAFIALTEALTGQGQLNDANTALNEANGVQPVDKEILLSADRAAARLLARTGRVKEARSLEEEALKRAKRMGFTGWQLRFELVSGELGAGGSARKALLQRVEKEAGSKGYGLIKDQAKRLLASETSSFTTKGT